MGRKKALQIGQTPPYPLDSEAKDYVREYIAKVLPIKEPRLGFLKQEHNRYVDVLVTWGINGILFVYSYPPAGFVVKAPEDVLKLQTFEGWIWEQRGHPPVFNILLKHQETVLTFSGQNEINTSDNILYLVVNELDIPQYVGV